jgi:hypothetical protein
VYRQLQRLIQERTSVLNYRELIQENTRVQTAKEIDIGEDNFADSYRDLILEMTSVNSYRG